MALVLLRRFATSIEAAIARGRLEAEGVESFLFDVEDQWDTFYRTILSVRLMVAEECLEEAVAVLAALDNPAGSR